MKQQYLVTLPLGHWQNPCFVHGPWIIQQCVLPICAICLHEPDRWPPCWPSVGSNIQTRNTGYTSTSHHMWWCIDKSLPMEIALDWRGGHLQSPQCVQLSLSNHFSSFQTHLISCWWNEKRELWVSYISLMVVFTWALCSQFVIYPAVWWKASSMVSFRGALQKGH